MRPILLGFASAFCLFLLSCSTPTLMPLGLAPWPYEHSDLAADPDVTWGRLDNGLRYAILPHAAPSGRASVCLLVQTGSYEENATERGYAHLVEHVVFRGSARFPGNSAVETMRRLGLWMGADINANTGLFITEYHMNDIPLAERAALPTCLDVLRGFAGSATFDPTAVAAERGVVLSEKRASDGKLDTAADQWEFVSGDGPTWAEVDTVFGNQRVADRNPIGTEATLNAATAEKLRAYYDHWYRPERMIVAIAGDVSPHDAEKLIRRTFSDLSNRSAAPRDPAPAKTPDRRPQPWVNMIGAPAEPAVQVSFCTTLPARPDTVANRRRQLAGTMALEMLRGRLEHAMETGGTQMTSKETVLSHIVPGQELWSIRVTTSPGAWSAAAVDLDAELRRAIVQGFTESEFSREVRRTKATAEGRVYESAVRPSGPVAKALATSIAYGTVFTSAEAERAQTEAQVATLSVGECNRALRELFGDENRRIAAFGPFKEDDANTTKLGKKLNQRRAAPLAPYSDFVPVVFPYAEFGALGTVITEVHDPALDADLIRFANGVRLNLKRTQFEPHRVRIAVKFGYGALTCPPDRPGLGLRSFAWALGGVGNLTLEQEHAALPELNGWDLTYKASSERFELLGVGSSGGADYLIQDFAAHFAHPTIGPTQWAHALELVRRLIAPKESTAAGAAENALDSLVVKNQALTVPPFEQVAGYTQSEFEKWFYPQLAAGPVEITVVGDFDPKRLRDRVARTFGALPTFLAGDHAPIDTRKIEDPATVMETAIAFDGPDQSAAVRLRWDARDITSNEQRDEAVLVARILEGRISQKLRAEMGETYAPSVDLGSNDEFIPSPTALTACIEVAPQRAAAIASVARHVAETLGREGATSDEFEEARQPLVAASEANRTDNAWWLTVLSTAQIRPKWVLDNLADLATYRAATLEQVNTVARQLLTPMRCSQAIAMPVGFAAKKLAREAADRGKTVDDARRYFTDRLAAGPEFADLVARRGGVSKLGLDVDALLGLAYVDRSGELFDRKDFTAAIAEDDKVIALEPKWSEGYNNRGAAKAGLADSMGAFADYSKAIEVAPKFVGGYTNRAFLELERKQYSAAIGDFDRAIELSPDAAELYHARGLAREESGDKRGAVADFGREERLLAQTAK